MGILRRKRGRAGTGEREEFWHASGHVDPVDVINDHALQAGERSESPRRPRGHRARPDGPEPGRR